MLGNDILLFILYTEVSLLGVMVCLILVEEVRWKHQIASKEEIKRLNERRGERKNNIAYGYIDDY